MSELLTVERAAIVMSVGKRTVERLIANGELRSVKIGRRRLVPEDAVVQYIRLAERRGRVA
jgi:excisionase family DNA binding protein